MLFNQNQDYIFKLERKCRGCNCSYRVVDSWGQIKNHYPKAWLYYSGYEDYCLTCYQSDEVEEIIEDDEKISTPSSYVDIALKLFGEEWPYPTNYSEVLKADILDMFSLYIQKGATLCLMPLSRIHIEKPLIFPSPIIVFPPDFIDVNKLNVRENNLSDNQAENASALSGITSESFNEHPLAVFPCKTELSDLFTQSHTSHLQMLRVLSSHVDRHCLDILKYQFCTLDVTDNLPGTAGQFNQHLSMAGALLYGSCSGVSRIVAGAVFTHQITKGLGLVAHEVDWNELPKEGEVGNIVRQALSMYSDILENSNPTAKFMQAMSLFEFLVSPGEYSKSEYLRKIIARYVAKDMTSYQAITGHLKNYYYGQGLRCEIVHNGKSLIEIYPRVQDRQNLFKEIDSYLRSMLNHMIERSTLTWNKYLITREQLLAQIKEG